MSDTLNLKSERTLSNDERFEKLFTKTRDAINAPKIELTKLNDDFSRFENSYKATFKAQNIQTLQIRINENNHTATELFSKLLNATEDTLEITLAVQTELGQTKVAVNNITEQFNSFKTLVQIPDSSVKVFSPLYNMQLPSTTNLVECQDVAEDLFEFDIGKECACPEYYVNVYQKDANELLFVACSLESLKCVGAGIFQDNGICYMNEAV